MTRIVVVLLSLFLVLPSLGFAGSATSRWDLTIGGYVKFDMGYNTQAQGQDVWLAARSGNGPYENSADRYGNFFSYAGETRLNFLTKGPDAWGAKTFAFIEGDFRGAYAGAGAGTFNLRQAFMQLEWPQNKLIIGQAFQKWGFLPTYGNILLDFVRFTPFLGGARQPQIRLEGTVAKDWNWAVAAISPTNTLGSNPNSTNTGVVDSFTLSKSPFFEGSVGWISDRCGNIGPWRLLFNLEGFYGKQKQVQQVDTLAGGVLTSRTFNSANVDSWGISFKGFVPIIPEKKRNKAGALSVSGVLFYTQNPSWYQGGGTAINSYPTTILDPSYHAPTTYGGWGQVSYFITDQLFVNGWYGYLRNNTSNWYNRYIAGTTNLQNTTTIVGNIMYDVNQAIRFGFEYAYFNTRYASPTGTAAQIAAYGGTTQKDGDLHQFRIGAYYFF